MLALPFAAARRAEESTLNQMIRIAACLLLIAAIAGCGGDPAAESRPLLKFDSRSISKTEFTAAFSKTLKPGQSLSAAERQELERAFLLQLVDRELTLAEARRRGLAVAPAEVAAALDGHQREYPAGEFEAMLRERGLTLAEWQAELAQSLLLDKLVNQVVGERGRAGDMEIDAYYAAHRSEFDRPAQVHARQIVVADQATGESLLARLRKGEAFAALARAHSLSPDAEQGGDLGFFGRDEMPPEFDAVFDLPVGKPSALVKSDYGYHLFLVEEKRPAAHLSRAEAAQEIRRTLEAQRREAVYQEWLQELRGKTAVEIDWNQLDPNPPKQ